MCVYSHLVTELSVIMEWDIKLYYTVPVYVFCSAVMKTGAHRGPWEL